MMELIKGKTLIVIDPVRTKIAKMADLFLQVRPRSDFYMAVLLSRFMYMEDMEDAAFLEERCEDADWYYDFLRTFRVVVSLEKCGITLDDLGDLLYQILFHAKISENRNEFNIKDVVESISEKMVRRHPHVFQEGSLETPEQVVTQWEEIKKQEKNNAHRESVLDGVPKNLPGLLRAQKLQKKAAKHGFDWDEITAVFDKLDEEVAEFKEAVLSGKEADVAGELGDILFVLVNIAKFKKIDAEEALRTTNNKFIQRFQYIEQEVAKRGKELKDTSLEELEQYWQEAKQDKSCG